MNDEQEPSPGSVERRNNSMPRPSEPISFRLPGSPTFESSGPDQSGSSAKGAGTEKLASFLLASLQVQHVLVLCGSGTSLCAGGPSMPGLWAQAVGDTPSGTVQAVLDAVGYKPAVGTGNIEELLSRCDALRQVRHELAVEEFRTKTIKLILDQCQKPGLARDELRPHKEFLRRLARRRARDSRLKLFTTNYDLCFERAASELGLIPIDGFSFAQPRRFDPRFFDYDIVHRGGSSETTAFVAGVFMYLKLHGSVDWATRNRGTEIASVVAADEACLIYPAKTKYQRSFQQPHLELMAQYLSALRQPNTCLLVVGFGFADDHITEPILSALETNPHFRVIVADPKVQDRLADAAGSDNWSRISALADSADVGFVNATFSDFVGLIPDLRALTPAERLERAVRGIAEER